MTLYKKCKCVKCGNLYTSKRENPRCIKGTLKGCGSTLVIVDEVIELSAPQLEIRATTTTGGFQW